MKNILTALLAAFLVTGFLYAQNSGLAPYPIWGQAYVVDGATEMTNIGTSYTTITSYTTATGNGITWDAGKDIATLGPAGLYFVALQLSFTGTNSAAFDCALFKADTTEINEIHFTRTMGAAAAVGSASANGIVSLTAGETLRVKCHGNAASDDMTPTDAQFTIIKIG